MERGWAAAVTGCGFVVVADNAHFSIYVCNCSNCADDCLTDTEHVVFLPVQFPPW